MSSPTSASLRDRLSPPRRGAPARLPGSGLEKALALAGELFDAAGIAAVVARPDGLAVEGLSGAGAGAAREAACRLFEALAASGAEDGGVLEEVAPGRGFVAATPILAPEGRRCLGALCLVDEGRRTLLSGLQRRLFAELGRLLAPALVGGTESRLQNLAEAERDAVALFDPDGRCLVRNRLFDALLGTPRAGAAGASPAEVPGRDAEWFAGRLMRERPPVGVYRAALSDRSWLHVEERRGPLGRSLVARIEAGAGLDDPEDRLLFERCPSPMFVFDRDTRAILAANDAALALYGWDRDAFLRLGLDGLGPVAGAEGRWTHRARDGRELPVAGRTADIELRGRAAVLVMLAGAPAASFVA